MEKKERTIKEILYKIANNLAITTTNMEDMIPELKAKQKEWHHMLQDYRIKSKIQSYDIRDAPEYHGILELEKELLATTDLTVAML